jgi:hypothetical protein
MFKLNVILIKATKTNVKKYNVKNIMQVYVKSNALLSDNLTFFLPAIAIKIIYTTSEVIEFNTLPKGSNNDKFAINNNKVSLA